MRDGYRCAISGFYDMDSLRALPEIGREHLSDRYEVSFTTYIVPGSGLAFANTWHYDDMVS